MTNCFLLTLISSLFICSSCSSGKEATAVNESLINEGNDPHFKITANRSGILKNCNRKVVVFGVPIYAVPKVPDQKLLHAANVMAQYLDNDENGQVDDINITNAMHKNKAFVVMWNKESDLEKMEMPENAVGQDLGNEETNPSFVKDACKGRFDASLEEMLHIITHGGYATAYPTDFSETASTLTRALDKARGGHFETIPTKYPATAWFTYYDKTADYSTMATEYLYWSITSVLGAQKNRLGEVGDEWRLVTEQLVREKDPDIYKLIKSKNYKLPTNLPTGSYNPKSAN